jgi:signal transduction histidine kinase
VDREPPARDAVLPVADAVAHDLGNLLGVIAGQVALLEAVVRQDPEARESVDEIKKAVDAAVRRLHELAVVVRKASGSRLMGD